MYLFDSLPLTSRKGDDDPNSDVFFGLVCGTKKTGVLHLIQSSKNLRDMKLYAVE